MARGVDGMAAQAETICPTCGARGEKFVVDEVRGELICSVCGTVLQDHMINYGPEWRVFGAEDDLSRVRAGPISPRLPNHGLGNSRIGIRSMDSPSLKARLRGIAKISQFLSSGQERRVSEILDLVKALKVKLNLPSNIIDDSVVIFRQLQRCGAKGLKTRELVVALVYVACKRNGIPCRLRDLVSEVGVERGKGISKAISMVRGCLGNSSMGIGKSWSEEVGRFLRKLVDSLRIENEEIRPQIIRLSMEIIKEGKRQRITNGRTFHALVASAVYVAASILNIKKKQREVAEVAKVTDVTVRNRYKEILSKIDIIVEI